MSAQQALLAHYVDLHPDEAARPIDRLPAGEVAQVLASMDVHIAATLVRHLAPMQAARGIATMAPANAAAVLTDLAPDIAASLLRRLDRTVAADLLAALPTEHASGARALLVHPADSAGGVMDPLVLVAPVSASVGETQALVSGQPEHLYFYLYVVDPSHRLVGVVDVAELLQATSDQPLEAVMHTNVLWLAAESSLEAVFAHPGWHQYDALPVLDVERRFLGAIRHRQIRQLLEARRAAPPAEPAVTTVMALGEIYWFGLCGLLQGVASMATAASARENAR